MPGAVPEGYSPGPSLGFGSFTLAVDDKPMVEGLSRAERKAKQASAAIGQQFGKGSNAAMGLLYLGQAVDDVQYGFRAIVNNIPQITLALGGGVGLAGVVGIAAVAANQLMQHWDDIANLFRTDFMARQAKITEELAEKTKEAADEAERLLAAVLPSHEAGGEIIKKGIIGAGSKQVLEAITDALLSVTKSKVTQRGGEFFEAGKLLPITPERAAAIQKREREAIDAKAKGLLGSAGTDEASRKIVEKLMVLAPGAFAGVPAFGKAIRAAEPGRMAETAMLNKQAAESEAIDKDIEATRKLTEAKIEAAGQAEEEGIQRTINATHMKQRQKLQNEIDIAEGHHRHLMDQQRNIHPSQIFQGTRAFSSSMLTGGLDQIAKQQLKEAEKLNLQIGQMRKDLANVGKMKFDN